MIIFLANKIKDYDDLSEWITIYHGQRWENSKNKLYSMISCKEIMAIM